MPGYSPYPGDAYPIYDGGGMGLPSWALPVGLGAIALYFATKKGRR
jgi:hypothetical protein